jgi:hypothetical protein
MPPGVVSDTIFAPALFAGVTAVTAVGLTTVKFAAGTPPIVTAVVPVKSVPVIVIAVPPAIGPAVGPTDAIIGCGK